VLIDLSTALDLSRDALLTTLILVAPILAVGMGVGLIISLIQTITQLQDQTFAIVPKIVAMLAAAAFFVPWIAQRLIEYSQEMFAGP
jgi:flagellar biosynthetic protein FliQ